MEILALVTALPPVLENAWISRFDPFADSWPERGVLGGAGTFITSCIFVLVLSLYMFICFCVGFIPGLENWGGCDPPTQKHRLEPLVGWSSAQIHAVLLASSVTLFNTHLPIQTTMSVYRWSPTYVVPHKIFLTWQWHESNMQSIRSMLGIWILIFSWARYM